MTRANDSTSVRRIVVSRGGDEYVVEIFKSVLTLRPKGSRSGHVRLTLEWGSLYLRALTAKLEAEAAEKRKAHKRGRK